jgi:hypothetical protein
LKRILNGWGVVTIKNLEIRGLGLPIVPVEIASVLNFLQVSHVFFGRLREVVIPVDSVHIFTKVRINILGSSLNYLWDIGWASFKDIKRRTTPWSHLDGWVYVGVPELHHDIPVRSGQSTHTVTF